MHGLRQEYDIRHKHGLLSASRSSSVAGSRPTTAESWLTYPQQPHLPMQPSQAPAHTSNHGSAPSQSAHECSTSWPFAQSPIPVSLAAHSTSPTRQQSEKHTAQSAADHGAIHGRSASDLQKAVAAMGSGISLQEHQQTLSPIRTQRSITSTASARSAHSQHILQRLVSVTDSGDQSQAVMSLSHAQQLQHIMHPGAAPASPIARLSSKIAERQSTQTQQLVLKPAAQRELHLAVPAQSTESVNQSPQVSAAAAQGAAALRKSTLLSNHFDMFDSDTSSEDEDAKHQVRTATASKCVASLQMYLLIKCWLCMYGLDKYTVRPFPKRLEGSLGIQMSFNWIRSARCSTLYA